MTGFGDVTDAYRSRARAEPFDFERDAPSPFTDTVAAAWSRTIREELSSSAERAWRGKVDERAERIGELGGNPGLARQYSMLPRNYAAEMRRAEREGRLEESLPWRAFPQWRDAYQHVREYEREYPDDVLDDDALLEAFKAEAAEKREAEQHVLDRGGAAAAFLGTGAAVMTDPLILMTLPFGGGVGAGRSVGQAFMRTAAVEGSIAAATEIPIQAEVHRFKRELEAPWTFADSAINVLAATVGGAGLGGLVGGGTQGARNMLERYRAAKADGAVRETDELADAEFALESTVALDERNPLEVESLTVDGRTVTTQPTDLHREAFDVARTQEETGQPVDVAEIVQGAEPEDGISNVLRRSEDPTELVDIDPTTVDVDARTFQFKAGADAAGVTDTLADVTRFDRTLAGVALIWERADGQRFIADGHQRLALARRALAAGQDPDEVRLNGFVLREADGVTASDARQMAAVKNMAEGTGSAIDAAKILREVGPAGEAMLPPLPPRSALVRQARGLAQLDDEQFMSVVNEVIEARFGAMIGAATDDSAMQQALVQLVARTRPANETQARSIIDQAMQAGTETRVTEDLFGEQQVTESLYLERAQVLDAALREARKDKTVFGRLVAEADRITEAGENRLDQAANMRRIQEANHGANQRARERQGRNLRRAHRSRAAGPQRREARRRRRRFSQDRSTRDPRRT